MIRMRCLLFTIIFKELLCDVTSKQREIKPTVSKYSANDFFSSNIPLVSIGNRQQQNFRRNSPISNVDTNNNAQNSKMHQTFISYYSNLLPFIEDSVQEYINLSDEYNSDFSIDQRSIQFNYTNYHPPVELHHGYRYFDPAISFSNYTNLSNVIYNELGLSENHSTIKSADKGLIVQEPLKENPIKSNIGPESVDNMLDVSSNIKNVNYPNCSNITILLPVKNFTFSSNYSQPYESSSTSKGKNHVNELNSNYSLKSLDKIINIYTMNPVLNSTSNLNLLPSAQISQDFKTVNMKNVSIYSQKELVLNIKPNVENFQSIVSQNVSLKLPTNSPLKLNELVANYPQIENKFMCGHYSPIQFHEHLQKPFKGNVIVNKTDINNSLLSIAPYNTTIVNNFNRMQNVQYNPNIAISNSWNYENFNRISQQTNRDEHAIRFSQKK
ncbi:uncharacterized protein ACRADG_006984 [Cochliomyia hominivorax]